MKSHNSRWISCAAALSLCFITALASPAQQTPTTPPAQPPLQNQQSPPAQPDVTAPKPGEISKQPNAPLGPGAPVNSSSYKVGAADVLNVQVWDEARFSGPVVVHEDGMFTMPLVGDLKAAGMTPVEVEGEVSKALAKYVVKPLVTVTVQQVGSKQYYMDGQINRAGEYTLVVPTTILEAISKAGGVQPFANPKKIIVLRGSERIRFNLKEVQHGKNMAQNILLKPGDHVIVY